MKIYYHRFKICTTLVLLIFSSYTAVRSQTTRPVHIGFIYPISTNGLDAPDLKNNFSLHALGGLSSGENGLAIYGLAGMVHGNVIGLQVAGLWSKVRGEVDGVQIAGLMNEAKNANHAIQIAGIVNLLEMDVPVQVAGIFNKARHVQGFQTAGILNLSQSTKGAQVAGIANLSKAAGGIQVAGIMNNADSVNGVQVAGIVNRAKKVKGVQIAGIVNIAESSDYPIGIINLIKDGEIRLGLYADENLTSMITLKSGGKKLYGIVGLGSNLQYSELPYALEAGIGLKVLDRGGFRLDVEGTNLFITNFKRRGEYSRSGLKVLPALVLSDKVEIFAGPSINYMHTKYAIGDELAEMSLWNRERRNVYKAIHLGLSAGINFKIN
ncbi:hypothetical protein [Cyclobacterium marinum]|uniref:Uncharacterized protein n=1 Tax=Cyclobacterium marinum (strain ATCC 25205 / DSM 745 / LMG 13164 / NCIMB 1802) TaxID=880070 RepID=G0J621_CYCMS|nr:hypothetical protein [Cyclobacterium marinum]AEL26084.1 hypothetical protein Cycma_2342 [Cyclobacterium marinum DSM 745]